MYLNKIKPNENSRKNKKRVGRGIGCGSGKTCGLGHKGQKSRSGGKVALGFEGGQMPIHRRLPKFGFTSKKKETRFQIRTSDISKLNLEEVSIDLLKKKGIISKKVKKVKIISNGKLDKKVKLIGIDATKSVQALINSF